MFQYALVDKSGKHSLADLRSYQDWYLRYYLKAVPGVAEVASLGGFGRQYQVNVDPNRLRNYGLPIQRVVEAVRGGNAEVGGRLIEFGGTEYMVRGRGYAQSIADFETHRRLRERERHADPHPGHRPGDGRPGPAPRRRPTSTARARSSPASSSCARARTRST